jgi:hypothetical protein
VDERKAEPEPGDDEDDPDAYGSTRKSRR